MATVVLGSVLLYSVYLPETAPKQITLAVLPFSEQEEITPFGVGFAASLRDSIALSRDVAVVDSLSTNLVMLDKEQASGMAHVLALTHFVDGAIRVNSESAASIEYRVVNVSHPNWKEVTTREIQLSDEELKPWQAIRDEMTVAIRGALYDNSLLRTETKAYNEQAYVAYLETLGSFLIELVEKPASDTKYAAFDAFNRTLYEATGIAPEPQQELWDVQSKFSEDLNVSQYAQSLWHLAGEYPNSSAVAALAQLAFDLNYLELAEHAWLHAARVNPQSALVALSVADVRRVLDKPDGLEQALRIATLRARSDLVDYFIIASEKLDDGSIPLVSEASHPETFKLLENAFELSKTEGIAIDLLIHEDQLAERRIVQIEPTRLWQRPPKFMRVDDPRWLRAQRYLGQISPATRLEIGSGTLAIANDAEAVQQLFAPRRSD
ncbi:MAG: hypothetical protein F4W90_02775 [Gammaproteobacteria bacterium]|nr:hypothetical protein [Gammaproteobacteria bacterium]